MIKIINPGILSTIQDQGRFGFRNLGVPNSGAMDNYSFKIANWAVSNFPNTPSIEVFANCFEFLGACMFPLFCCCFLSDLRFTVHVRSFFSNF